MYQFLKSAMQKGISEEDEEMMDFGTFFIVRSKKTFGRGYL